MGCVRVTNKPRESTLLSHSVQGPVSFCENTATPCRSGSYGLLVHRRGCLEQLGLLVLLVLALLVRAPILLRALQLPPASPLCLPISLKLRLCVSVPHLKIDCMNRKFSLLSDNTPKPAHNYCNALLLQQLYIFCFSSETVFPEFKRFYSD